MRAALTLCLMACAAAAHAQTMFKCKSPTGAITYTNINCEKQGLRQVGEVQDRVMVMPSNAPNPIPPQKKETKAAPADPGAKPGAAVKPINPVIEGLAK